MLAVPVLLERTQGFGNTLIMRKAVSAKIIAVNETEGIYASSSTQGKKLVSK